MRFRRGGGEPPSDGSEVTRRIDRAPDRPAVGGDDADKTVRVPRPQSTSAARISPSAAEPDDDEPKTRLFGPPGARPPASERPAPKHLSGQIGPEAQAEWDPVVGWLVIIDGPGRGRSLALGYGMNHIGRDAGQKISLAFGDELVSRSSHAALTYDPVSRKFFIQHGGGRNLTYLDGNPVLAPTEITGGEKVQVGQTSLQFVPFCGPEFEWHA